LYSIREGLSTGKVKPTIGPPPPNVVADVPLPLDPNGELVDDPVPEVGDEDPNIEELPFCDDPGEPDDPKLDPDDPKLDPEDPKLDPDDPKLDPEDPRPEELPPVPVPD
jgi:hypothetical protein